MTSNKIIHQCSKCSKIYKAKSYLKKHEENCTGSISPTNTEEQKNQENNYDVNMTFLEGNKVEVEVKKQPNEGEDKQDGEKVLKEILKPKISPSYQDEIDKLESLVKVIKSLPISDDPEKKDQTIGQLKNTLAIVMTQSKNLIKEMQNMSRRNSYFKNNIILASFILDKCRKDVPETEEEYENMFN